MKFIKIITASLLAASLVLNICASSIEMTGIFDRVKEFFGYAESTDDELPIEDITPPRGDKAPLKNESTAETFSASPQNWYFKHTKNGVRPPMPAESSYISKYNGYFLGPDEKVIYLTFDAGYENGNIAKILDTLKSEDVPAAFFVLENLVTRETELVRRMIDEGHTVCNHTASHKDMTKCTTKEEFAAELSKMEEIYRNTLGEEIAKIYRPPEGKLSEANLAWANELGYKTVFWSFAYADWDNKNQPDPERAIEKILAETHNGEIILLHPTSAANAEILPKLISEWRNMGYRFGVLDELGKECADK